MEQVVKTSIQALRFKKVELMELRRQDEEKYDKAEGQVGAEASISSSMQEGSGPLKAGFGVGADTFSGARANADASIAADPKDGNVGAGFHAGAFAGAGTSLKGSVTAGYTTATGEVGVEAGVGASIGGDLQLKDGHLKANVDLNLALGLGLKLNNVGVNIDVGSMAKDVQKTANDVTNFTGDVAKAADEFTSWLNPFD